MSALASYITEFREFTDERRRRIEALPSDSHRLAFAASCCDRLLASYANFQQKSGWGDVGYLRRVLDKAWTNVHAPNLSPQQATLYRERLRELVPSEEDWPDQLSADCYGAQHFCSALDRTLRFILEGDAETVSGVGDVAYNAVNEFVRDLLRSQWAGDEPGGSSGTYQSLHRRECEIAEQAWRHPLVQDEVSKQLTGLTHLERIADRDLIQSRVRAGLT